MAMGRVVLDSSVILAHMNREPGSDALAELFNDALISTVNVCEVFSKLLDWAMPLPLIKTAFARYGLQPVPFDMGQAEKAGLLRVKTKAAGLSLGDRACLAVGETMQLPVFTADREWHKLDLGLDIRLIR